MLLSWLLTNNDNGWQVRESLSHASMSSCPFSWIVCSLTAEIICKIFSSNTYLGIKTVYFQFIFRNSVYRMFDRRYFISAPQMIVCCPLATRHCFKQWWPKPLPPFKPFLYIVRFIWKFNYSTLYLWCRLIIQAIFPHDDIIKWKLFFRVTGPLWGESTGHQWILLTKASDVELWCFLWYMFEQTSEQTIETPVIWDTIALIMT